MSKKVSNNKMSAVPYDTVKFRVPNGSKEKLIQYAKEHGYSLNALICDALYLGLETTIKEYLSQIQNF